MSGLEWLTTSPVALVVMAGVVLADAFLVVVPGEAAVTAMGAVAARTGAPPLVAVIAVAALAAWCGDASCYTLGRVVGTRWLYRFGLRRALERAGAELRRRGAVILFTARFVPFARLAVNVAAGAARTPVPLYLSLAGVSALGWALTQASLGAVISALIPGGPVVAVVVSVVVALAIGVGVDALIAAVRRRRASPAEKAEAAETARDTAPRPPYSQVNTPRPGRSDPMTTEIDDDRALEEIKQRLAERFPGRPAGEVAAVVDEVHASMADAHVKDFVPLLVEKNSARRLKK